MLFLSEIPGRFPVGATTFATPVRPPRTVGSAKLRGTKQPALNLDEVAFTVYYPTDVIAVSSAAKGLNWMLRPVKETLRGLASFSAVSLFVIWPLVYLFGTFIKIPVYPNAPLLHPKKAKPFSSVPEEKFISEQWPLVIFSHGLGGSRTAYSQLCSRIAASGKVVLALEHRDGTGYAAMRRTWDAEGKYLSKPIIYYQKEDVILNKDATKDANPLPLRTEQLDFRRQEIYIAYETFSRFIRQEPASELSVLDDSTRPLDSWKPVDPVTGDEPICCSEGVTLAGHSFGGCTVISILSTDPPEGCDIIPATNALILGPWVEPFPTNNPTPRYPRSSTASIGSASTEHSTSPTETTNLGSEAVDLSKHDSRLPRMLVINSETFTLWQDHFAKLQDIVKSWEPHGRRIITLVGSGHTAFSDFPVLPLIRTKGSQMLMDTISKLSIAFIDGELEQAVGSASERSMQIEIVGKAGDGRPKRQLAGTIGDIIVS